MNHKGYPRINGGAHVDEFLHRAVWEYVAGRPLPPGWHVHHMRGKLCWEPESLVASPACLHPVREALRDPYTGRFISAAGYERRYGAPPHWL